MDVDDFKQINDRWGHEQGDKVLVWIGKALRINLRPSDLLARLGGDELAILLPDGMPATAMALMEKVQDSLRRSNRELGVTVSVSMGIATFYRVTDTVEEMLRVADRQMYRVKQNGKNSLEHEVLAS